MQKLQANSFLSLAQAALFLVAQAKRPCLQKNREKERKTWKKNQLDLVSDSRSRLGLGPYKVAGMSGEGNSNFNNNSNNKSENSNGNFLANITKIA